MEPENRIRRGSLTFNPNAATFNPGAPEFKPAQSDTNAAAERNAGPALPQDISMATTRADTPVQHAELLVSTFPNVVIPHIQSTPLRHLIPSSSAPPPWATELENHALNLGLPIAPSHSNPVTSDTHNEIGGTCKTFDPVIAPPKKQQFTQIDALVPDGKHPGILFPLETRAHGLDGKLVQQALMRTLTAGDLAKHLESSNIFAIHGSAASPHIRQFPSDSAEQPATTGSFQTAIDQGILRPPPGLAIPRDVQMTMNLYNLQSVSHLEQQPKTPPPVPRTEQEASGALPYPFNLHSPVASYRHVYESPQTLPAHPPHHALPSSHSVTKPASRGRRLSCRGRFTTKPFVMKPKRADQGPMPSSADIYPEDAVSPNAQFHGGTLGMHGEQHSVEFGRGARMSQPPSMLPANLHVEDATAWPTPAEAKTTKAVVGVPSFCSTLANPSDTRGDEQHPEVPPLTELTTVPDANIAASMALPPVSDRIGCLSLIPDCRPLTPGQLNGSRYGLRFFGIGFKDDWIPPTIKDNTLHYAGENSKDRWPRVAFRTRPRLHDGWGGWEWAHKVGWYQGDD